MSTACKFCGLVGDHLSNCPLWPPAAYPDWLRKAAAKGGKTSKRKLSKREARRIASAGWEGAVGAARQAKLRAKTHNTSMSQPASGSENQTQESSGLA